MLIRSTWTAASTLQQQHNIAYGREGATIMRRTYAYLISAVLLGGICSATAETVCTGLCPAGPTKTITFHNNSTNDTIFPVIQVPIRKDPIHPTPDQWMQAQFKVTDPATQAFYSTLLYKIYVQRNTGIPPGGSVTITLPFYTQLLPADASNLGRIDDQFIDWWNAMRIYIFDGKDAVNAAYNYSVDALGNVVKPTPVHELAGAALPSCSSDNITCESLVIVSYVNGFPLSVPVQLVEYTFACATSPTEIRLECVNYNISGVDWMYLPAAIGARGNGTSDNTYLGSTEPLDTFRNALTAFTANGTLWPFFVPSYYTAQNPTIPLATPPPGVNAYPLPQIPSTNVVYAESFRNPPPAPPVLSSDTLEN